jgi:hypothetical protein
MPTARRKVRFVEQIGHSTAMPPPILELPQWRGFVVTDLPTIRRLSQEKRAQLKNLTASLSPHSHILAIVILTPIPSIPEFNHLLLKLLQPHLRISPIKTYILTHVFMYVFYFHFSLCLQVNKLTASRFSKTLFHLIFFIIPEAITPGSFRGQKSGYILHLRPIFRALSNDLNLLPWPDPRPKTQPAFTLTEYPCRR